MSYEISKLQTDSKLTIKVSLSNIFEVKVEVRKGVYVSFFGQIDSMNRVSVACTHSFSVMESSYDITYTESLKIKQEVRNFIKQSIRDEKWKLEEIDLKKVVKKKYRHLVNKK